MFWPTSVFLTAGAFLDCGATQHQPLFVSSEHQPLCLVHMLYSLYTYIDDRVALTFMFSQTIVFAWNSYRVLALGSSEEQPQ